MYPKGIKATLKYLMCSKKTPRFVELHTSSSGAVALTLPGSPPPPPPEKHQNFNNDDDDKIVIASCSENTSRC